MLFNMAVYPDALETLCHCKRPLARAGILHVRRLMITRICMLLCVLALSACDTVTNQYATLEDARKDRLFERGWLPDILPPSAKNIRTANNLDVNTSEGEFYFDVAEYRPFEARLRPFISAKSPFWESYINRKTQEGYSARQYTAEGTRWVFLCNQAKAHCAYRMWVIGNAG